MSTPPRLPQNNSRMVIEGLDKPLPRPKLKDRIKIDPYSPSYKRPGQFDPVKRA